MCPTKHLDERGSLLDGLASYHDSHTDHSHRATHATRHLNTEPNVFSVHYVETVKVEPMFQLLFVVHMQNIRATELDRKNMA